MKKALNICVIVLILIIVITSSGIRAGIVNPDLLTPHTNTISSHGYITITNNAVIYVASVSPITNNSGVVTNIAVTFGTNFINATPYFAYNNTSVSYGDSSASAWATTSNNFAFVQNEIAFPVFTNPPVLPMLVLSTNWTPANCSNFPASGLGSVWADTNWLYYAAAPARIFRIAWNTNAF